MNTSEHLTDQEAEYQPLLDSKEGPGVEGNNTDSAEPVKVQEGSQPKKEVKYLMGMAVKKDTTYWNIMLMPLLPFITCTINFYATAFMPLLL